MRPDATMTFLIWRHYQCVGCNSCLRPRAPAVFAAYLALAVISSMLAGWSSGWFLL
jgi:hypothetical protein